jgi:uncharacterized protein
MIRESIVTTRSLDGDAHIAPMGVHVVEDTLVIAPFRPSATLDNLLREPRACINYPDDVRVYAGCLTGRREWPVRAADRIDGLRLVDCLAHAEVEVKRTEDDGLRPRFHCRVVFEAMHAPFRGFNRAQAAVIELAILVSRLDRLPQEKVEREVEYLGIAVDKTAGPRERQAWEWLMTKVNTWRADHDEISQ